MKRLDPLSAAVLAVALVALVLCAFATGEHAAVALGTVTTIAAALTRGLLMGPPASEGVNTRTESAKSND